MAPEPLAHMLQQQQRELQWAERAFQEYRARLRGGTSCPRSERSEAGLPPGAPAAPSDGKGRTLAPNSTSSCPGSFCVPPPSPPEDTAPAPAPAPATPSPKEGPPGPGFLGSPAHALGGALPAWPRRHTATSILGAKYTASRLLDTALSRAALPARDRDRDRDRDGNPPAQPPPPGVADGAQQRRPSAGDPEPGPPPAERGKWVWLVAGDGTAPSPVPSASPSTTPSTARDSPKGRVPDGGFTEARPPPCQALLLQDASEASSSRTDGSAGQRAPPPAPQLTELALAIQQRGLERQQRQAERRERERHRHEGAGVPEPATAVEDVTTEEGEERERVEPLNDSVVDPAALRLPTAYLRYALPRAPLAEAVAGRPPARPHRVHEAVAQSQRLGAEAARPQPVATPDAPRSAGGPPPLPSPTAAGDSVRSPNTGAQVRRATEPPGTAHAPPAPPGPAAGAEATVQNGQSVQEEPRRPPSAAAALPHRTAEEPPPPPALPPPPPSPPPSPPPVLQPAVVVPEPRPTSDSGENGGCAMVPRGARLALSDAPADPGDPDLAGAVREVLRLLRAGAGDRTAEEAALLQELAGELRVPERASPRSLAERPPPPSAEAAVQTVAADPPPPSAPISSTVPQPAAEEVDTDFEVDLSAESSASMHVPLAYQALQALAGLLPDADTVAQLEGAVRQAVGPLLRADHCAVLALEGGRLQGADGAPELPLVGIVGRVARKAEALHLTDPASHDLFDERVDVAAGACSVLPLLFRGEVLGVLRVARLARAGGPFAEEEREALLQAAAGLAAQLAHGRLVTAVHREQQAVATLSSWAALMVAAGPALSSVVATALPECRIVTGASHASLFLPSAAAGHLDVYTETGPAARVAVGQGLVTLVMGKGEPIVVADTSSDRRYRAALDALPGTRSTSVLYQPLKFEGRVVGVVRLADRLGPRGAVLPFGPDDAHLMTTIAGVLAVALHRALRHQPVLSPILHARFLRSVRQLMAAWPEEPALAQQLLTASLDLTGAAHGALYVLRPDSEEFLCYRSDGTVTNAPYGAGLVGYVAAQGMLVNAPAGKPDARRGSAPRPTLCVPVTDDGGEVQGVLELLDKKGPPPLEPSMPFTGEDEACMVHVAACAAGVLRACRRHATTAAVADRQRALVDHLGSLLTADLSSCVDVLDAIQSAAAELLDADGCTAFYRDAGAEELVCAAPARGEHPPDSPPPLVEHRYRLAQGGLAADAVLTGQTVNLHFADADPEPRLRGLGGAGGAVRAVLCVPLFHRKEVVGVLQAVRREGPAFLREDQQVVEWFAGFAAAALFAAMRYTCVAELRLEAVTLLRALLATMNASPGDHPVKACLRDLPSLRRPLELDPHVLDQCAGLRLAEPQRQAAVGMEFDAEEFAEPLAAIPLLTKFFADLGVLGHFALPPRTLHAFLLRVAAAYRPLPYHNFRRAVDAAQLMYDLLLVVGREPYFDPLELFVLLLSSLLHGVDHVGLNNNCHARVDTPVAPPSDTLGAMEIHHCLKGLQVLTAGEANVFDTLEPADLADAYPLLVGLIMSADPTKPLPPLGVRAQNGPKYVAMQHVVRVAAMSTVARSFGVAQRWATSLTREFLGAGGTAAELTGDAEEAREIARSQVWYLDHVAWRAFQAVAEWDSSLHFLLRHLQQNRARWIKVLADVDGD